MMLPVENQVSRRSHPASRRGRKLLGEVRVTEGLVFDVLLGVLVGAD